MPESLFDDFRRTDDRPALFDEPAFRFLNRGAGPVWQRVRDLLDEWFSRVPDEEAQADLRGRLRSGAEVGFRSAFFELYCHEALRRAGWALEHHPLLLHTSRRPDLRASRGGVAAYVEVTTTSTPRLDEAATRRLNTVIDKINDRIEVDQFSLGMEVLSVGNNAPATEPLCTRLQAWLAGLDPDQLITRRRGNADDGTEFLEWEHQGWHLVFEASPLPPDHRGPGGRILSTLLPAEAQPIDDVKPLRKRLSEKAKAYGDLNAPFVIAVDAVSHFTEDRDFTAALYGTPAWRYYENPGPGAPPPTRVHLPDGLWTRPHGLHNTQVSAVLASTRITPWTIGSAVPTLWHHPGADQPVSNLFPLLRQARPRPTRREIQYDAPEMTPCEFFELPEGWPGRDW